MSPQELKAFIETERNLGTSDIKIFNKMLDNPKFVQGIRKSNDQGYSNRHIAAALGLKISNQPVDLPQIKRDSEKKQAKEQGETKLWESGLLGFSDLGAGVLQGVNYAADGISKGINKVAGTNLDTKSYERFTNQRKEIEESHNLRRQENGQGFDWGRLGGQIAGTAPMSALGRGYNGAQILSKAGAGVAAQNAAVGAGIGAASFANDADQRKMNTALGGIGGAVGGAVGEKVGQGVNKAVNTGRNTLNKFSTTHTNQILQSIDQKLNEALKPMGVKLSDLSDDVARNLRDDAKKALQGGKELNPEAVMRKAALEQVGIKGTRAQISGDAKHWQQEAELAKLKGAGDDLREKFISDNNQLAKLLDDEITASGGKSIDRLSTGKDIADSLLDQHAQNKQFIKEAYEAASRAPGNDVIINGQGFSNDVFTELEDKALASFLPTDITKIVKQINDNPNFFTLKKGEELIKILNDHYKSSLSSFGEPTSTTRALGVVRQALNNRQDEALQGLLSQGGNDAAQAYQFARNTFKANKSLQAKMPLLQDVLKQQSKGSVNYDKLYQKHIIGGNVEELSQTISVLKNTNPQAVANIQQEVINDITEKAINSNGTFSPAGMKRVLDALGDRKLNILFSKDQVKRLKDIKMAGHYAKTEPAHSYVNHSNSSSGLMNHLMRVINSIDGYGRRIPGVSEIVTGRLNQAVGNNQVASALKGGSIANTSTVPQSINQPLIDRLVEAGILGGANLPNQ